jgi:crotonobetainyl-CoA:carnitine CoA-transferase CaiB-like acyl-CoA transferase
LCAALGLLDLAADPRFAANEGRVLHREGVVRTLAARLESAPREHWLAVLAAARVPAGPVRDVHEVVADPALAARGMIQSAALASGPVPLLGAPYRASGTRPPLRLPPPRLGQHTEDFLARFGG